MKNLKKDLQDVTKQLTAVSKKIEKLIAAVGKTEKPKAAKVKPAKKAVSKSPKKSVANAGKKAVAKKPTGKTAPETIMDVIQNRPQGVEIETLKEKTGFQGQKLYSTLSILKKRGKINNPRKGIWVKV